MPWWSIDRTTSIGEALYSYGKISYNEGFIIGFISGSFATSLIFLITKKV